MYSNTRFTLFGLSLVLLLVSTNVHRIDGLATGAPVADYKDLCNNMLPLHGPDAQTSAMPYKIMLSKNMIKGGEMVDVTLAPSQSGGAPFRGFLAIGRKEDYKNDKTPQGFFTASKGAKLEQCTSPSDAITQDGGTDKKEFKLKWQPPNEDGKYVLVATFVKSREIYWVEQPSEVVTVMKDGNYTETRPTAAPINSSTRISTALFSILIIYGNIMFLH